MKTFEDACMGAPAVEDGMPYTGEPLVFRDNHIFPDPSTWMRVGDVLEVGEQSTRVRVVRVSAGLVEYVPC